MLHVLRIPAYATLFSAQVIALVGTGLLTVALGLPRVLDHMPDRPVMLAGGLALPAALAAATLWREANVPAAP